MHTTQMTVRGFHLDVYQHVNNARFLEFLEEARWQMFEDIPLISFIRKKNLAFVLANININFLRPALINEVLDIQSQLIRIGSKSAVLGQKIFLSKTKNQIVDATVTFCILNQTTHKTVPLTGEVYTLLEDMI
uniref:acyl-CoA thioesterase n=1 Tax=Endozoicomonas sp. Mp262 TaxID=2919499 RepID=UPI00351AE1C0